MMPHHENALRLRRTTDWVCEPLTSTQPQFKIGALHTSCAAGTRVKLTAAVVRLDPCI